MEKRVRLVALLAFAVAGCSKPSPSPEHTVALEPATPATAPTISWPERSANADSPVREPSSVAAIPPKLNAPAINAAALEQRYALPSSRPETRSEIIQELGALGTSEAIRALSRIFARERREELRLEIIGAIADMDDDQVLEPKLSFLAAALSPKLSRLIREVAINSLSEIEDSRVIPLLRNLQFDSDEEIRALVAETLRELEE